MTDITDIKRMLAERAPAVAELLLPGGKRIRDEWRAGSVGGEPGQSLGVHLSGAKAGTWADFADAGQSGDLIDLWRTVRGQDLPEALADIRDWLGVEAPDFHRPAKREYTRPPKPRCQTPKGPVATYLEEDRGLPGGVLEAYRIGEDGESIIFPFILPDGELALAKRRLAYDGARPVPTARDCEPVLFGWQAMDRSSRNLVITEGEIDAMSLYAYDRPAVSVPFGGGGGGKQQWIENEFDRLQQFETIYLALDNDDQGEAAAQEIAMRLGRHRCVRVRLPRKDANQCLVDGIPPDEIDAAFAAGETYDPEGLRRVRDYTADVVGLFWPTAGREAGGRLPWAIPGDKLVFRPGEMTIWTGASGSGKSQVLSDSIVGWTDQGLRTCVASLEMKPAQTLKRMVKQTMGTDRPTEEAIQKTMGWLDAGVYIYDHVGKTRLATILEAFDYARARFGCDQFVIDSLMRLGVGSEDYEGQDAAVFEMVDWAVSRDVHLHLVAHARKGDRSKPGAPDTEDIKGASEIGSNAFNIVSIWRNRQWEEDLEKAETEAARDEIRQAPGVVLNVAKQRNGDWEGKVSLWFDQETYQYRTREDNPKWPRKYVRLADEEAK